MRVLIYSPSNSLVVGGKEIYSILLGINLHKLGCEVTVFLSLGKTYFISDNLNELKTMLEDNFSLLKNSSHPRNSYFNKFLREWGDSKKISELISKNDILYVNIPSPSFDFFPLKAKIFRKFSFRGWIKAKTESKIKTITILHGTPNESIRGSLEYINEMNKIQKNIVLSNVAKNFLVTQGLKNSIKVISTGVDTNFFYPRPIEEKTNFINILFVGRIEEEKGLDELIESFKICKVSGLKIKLKIVGKYMNSKYKNYISKKIQEFKKDIEIIETVNYNQMPEVYKTSDIFILPSHFEGMPLSILEAMSSGLSVITTKVGGIPELITDGINGLLIEKGDITSLSQAIEKLNKNEEFRKKLGIEARRTVLEKYDWKIISKKILNAYDE